MRAKKFEPNLNLDTVCL